MRDDRTGLLEPFHATRRGFRGMEPPQARPAQPTSLGTTIWTTTSYEVYCWAVSGMATRKVMPRPSALYSWKLDVKTSPVSVSL
jgi:hypothetical protein